MAPTVDGWVALRTLRKGYRPDTAIVCGAEAGGATVEVRIEPDGRVLVDSPRSGWIDLMGVSFPAARAQSEHPDPATFVVEGWIWKKNLRPFLEVASQLAGYGFDDLDWDAITVGVAEAARTEGQLDYNRFDYTLGELALLLRCDGLGFGLEIEADAEIEPSILVVLMVMEEYELTKMA